MPLLFIHLTNSDFRSRDEGADYDAPEQALKVGVQSAMALADDEVRQGKVSTAVEVAVTSADGKCMLRSVVAVSVSPLIEAETEADQVVAG